MAEKERGQTYSPFTVHLWSKYHLNIKQDLSSSHQFSHAFFIQPLFFVNNQILLLDKTLQWMLKIKPFHPCLVVFVVRNGRLMNKFCCKFQTNKTATLWSRLPTVSISPIFFNMFVYLPAVPLPFVNLHDVGRA